MCPSKIHVYPKPQTATLLKNRVLPDIIKLNSAHTGFVLSCSVVSNSFATPWAAARQAPLSMGFPRQEYWRWIAITRWNKVERKYYRVLNNGRLNLYLQHLFSQ